MQYDSYPTQLTNYCPTLPIDDPKYCLKASTGNFLGTYSGTASTFSISNTKGSVSYHVTDTMSPTSGLGGIDSHTKLMLHSESLLDSSMGARVMTNGGAIASTTQSKFGGSSLSLDGTTYVYAADSDDFEFGSGDFTVDLWFNPSRIGTSDGNNEGLVINTGGGVALTGGFGVAKNASNKILASAINGSTQQITITSATSVVAGNWYHIAFVRSGNNFNLYINGVSEASVVWAHPVTATAYNMAIGTYSNYLNSSTQYKVAGYLDEVHISKGVARWTSNFTPPTQAYSQ